MNAETFNNELSEIIEETRKKITDLMEIARDDDDCADGFMGTKAVSYADDPNWQRKADSLAEVAGWIYDRMNGKTRLDRGSMTKKLRKALGYTYP